MKLQKVRLDLGWSFWLRFVARAALSIARAVTYNGADFRPPRSDSLGEGMEEGRGGEVRGAKPSLTADMTGSAT